MNLLAQLKRENAIRTFSVYPIDRERVMMACQREVEDAHREAQYDADPLPRPEYAGLGRERALVVESAHEIQEEECPDADWKWWLGSHGLKAKSVKYLVQVRNSSITSLPQNLLVAVVPGKILGTNNSQRITIFPRPKQCVVFVLKQNVSLHNDLRLTCTMIITPDTHSHLY